MRTRWQTRQKKSLKKKFKARKTSAEIEMELNPHNVAYKIKDNTAEEEK
jgi:hypothetical protein